MQRRAALMASGMGSPPKPTADTHHPNSRGPQVQMIDGFPRRNRVDHWTPAEKAIQDAVDVVEAAGAHPLLTDAVILLGQARDKVADFVELPASTPIASQEGR